MVYNVEWDPEKAAANQHKHGVSFDRAATVFRDPNQISIYDETHSDDEERWITLGLDRIGILTVVVHTYRSLETGDVSLRIISARRATRNEARQYEEHNT